MATDRVYSTSTFREMKKEKEPIVMVTAYDYPSAKLAEEAGAEMILVGDSLGMVVLGYDSTIPVTLDDMVHHTKAVTRAAKRAFVVSDLPFMTYHLSAESTLRNAARLMQEGLAKAVKLEGGKELCPVIQQLVAAGIPVVGHIGLTPQSVHQLGGYKVQGRSVEDAEKLMEDALALQEAGVFAIVLECVPHQLGTYISERLDIPTIGIGAGAGCDGQVLVFHDMIQYASSIRPKFVKAFAQVGEQISAAISQYSIEVKQRAFPAMEHNFSMKEETIKELYGEKCTP
ncbi:3-methyl-2-oxobutanoate hydroxymethyltransferase [Ammoniphilus sp. CFH 90114]|uniref:3-methyl-2-oxobutanoate hydroxymethyltransferase n=1 Tax=Ammoniphilus sp. CFH 90114 TaxID=2493665 RepID=UPI00100E8A09|nr:3-methyl-2-oxobutanoate hydroxymethyltransferase [Ammoniphilus sp. CFH 90114]RXT13944.1 3-methyl-2-oxobutanoate hydroxymethyltransferase [Ammoniphilus sp. CFH 90114]